jgi:hypothetical protein
VGAHGCIAQDVAREEPRQSPHPLSNRTPPPCHLPNVPTCLHLRLYGWQKLASVAVYRRFADYLRTNACASEPLEPRLKEAIRTHYQVVAERMILQCNRGSVKLQITLTPA